MILPLSRIKDCLMPVSAISPKIIPNTTATGLIQLFIAFIQQLLLYPTFFLQFLKDDHNLWAFAKLF